MTSLAEQLGLGTPAEQDRITHDLEVVRKRGVAALRHQIDGHPVSADLYIAAVAQLQYQRFTRGFKRIDEEAAVDREFENRRGGTR